MSRSGPGHGHRQELQIKKEEVAFGWRWLLRKACSPKSIKVLVGFGWMPKLELCQNETRKNIPGRRNLKCIQAKTGKTEQQSETRQRSWERRTAN